MQVTLRSCVMKYFH